METIEYRTFDKSTWGAGPWNNEPDKKQWQDKDTGLPCLIVRNCGGALCGYVGVTENHPYFGKGYGLLDVDVHGGELTFADSCSEDERADRSICHLPGPGEPDHVWWFGFDCAHYMDFTPARAARLRKSGFDDGVVCEVYREVAYVEDQCRALARQLVEMQKGVANEGRT